MFKLVLLSALLAVVVSYEAVSTINSNLEARNPVKVVRVDNGWGGEEGKGVGWDGRGLRWAEKGWDNGDSGRGVWRNDGGKGWGGGWGGWSNGGSGWGGKGWDWNGRGEGWGGKGWDGNRNWGDSKGWTVWNHDGKWEGNGNGWGNWGGKGWLGGWGNQENWEKRW